MSDAAPDAGVSDAAPDAGTSDATPDAGTSDIEPYTGMSALAWAAMICWLVAVLLVVIPVTSDGGYLCGQALEATTRSSDCVRNGLRRLDWSITWLLVTAPVTLGYLARVASRRPK